MLHIVQLFSYWLLRFVLNKIVQTNTRSLQKNTSKNIKYNGYEKI